MRDAMAFRTATTVKMSLSQQQPILTIHPGKPTLSISMSDEPRLVFRCI